jgi:hypothetical protein
MNWLASSKVMVPLPCKARFYCSSRNIASLTMSAASSTFWAYESVHSEERHFALVEAVAFAMPTQAWCS